MDYILVCWEVAICLSRHRGMWYRASCEVRITYRVWVLVRKNCWTPRVLHVLYCISPHHVYFTIFWSLHRSPCMDNNVRIHAFTAYWLQLAYAVYLSMHFSHFTFALFSQIAIGWRVTCQRYTASSPSPCCWQTLHSSLEWIARPSPHQMASAPHLPLSCTIFSW